MSGKTIGLAYASLRLSQVSWALIVPIAGRRRAAQVLTAPHPKFFSQFSLLHLATTPLRHSAKVPIQSVDLRIRCGPPLIFCSEREDCKAYLHEAASC